MTGFFLESREKGGNVGGASLSVLCQRTLLEALFLDYFLC